MKTVIILSVLFMITVFSNFVFGRNVELKAANRAINNAIEQLSPSARQNGSSANPVAHRCAAKCDQNLQNVTVTLLPWREEQGRIEDHSTWAIFNSSIMANICLTYIETERCLDRCPESVMKANLKKKYIVRKFECHESTFVRTSDCIMDVTDVTYCNCTLGQQYLDQAWESQFSETQQGLKENLKNMCLAMKVLFECSQEILVERCGQAAAVDWQGWNRKYAEYRKNKMTDKGLAHLYPRECDRV